MKDESESLKDGAIPTIGERNKFSVSGKKSNNKLIIVLTFFILFILAIIIIVPKILNSQQKSEEPAKATQLDESLQTKSLEDSSISNTMAEIQRQQERDEKERIQQQQAAVDKAQKEKEAALRAQQAQFEQERAGGQTSLPNPRTGAYSNNGNQDVPPTPAQRKLMGSTLVDLGKPAQQSVNASSGGEMNDALAGEYYADGRIQHFDNLDYLLIHGTSMACALKTKIVTAYKGIVICNLTTNVFSANGKTLLFRRGAAVFGEQKVALTAGKARVFINWTEIDSSDGTRVRLDSLGTDSLGAAGAEAWVDNHWGERFSNSIMLSFIDDIFATGMQSVKKDGGGINIDSSTNNAQDMASKVLDAEINIPPTGYVYQGSVMNIMVPRNVDFSNHYINR